MPLIMLNVLPAGHVIVNTDDIVTVRQSFGDIEIFLRGIAEPVRVPHSTVAEVANDLRNRDNVVEVDPEHDTPPWRGGHLAGRGTKV